MQQRLWFLVIMTKKKDDNSEPTKSIETIDEVNALLVIYKIDLEWSENQYIGDLINLISCIYKNIETNVINKEEKNTKKILTDQEMLYFIKKGEASKKNG